MTKFKTISLFSGCGGLDLGFLGGFHFRNKSFNKNPFEIIKSVEFDPAIADIYNANINYFHHPATIKDVRDVEADEIPNYDILLAGFPCQPFSNAGLRKGVSDNRGTLFQECERFIRIGTERSHKPLAFVFENVRGILSSKMPDGTTVPEEIVKLMKALGYTTKYKLINAADYGVPSNRYRVIMVGVLDQFAPFDFSLLDEIRDKNGLPSKNGDSFELSLGRVLCDIPTEAPQFDEFWQYSPAGQYMVNSIGPCYGSQIILERIRESKSYDDFPSVIWKGRSWKNMNPDDMPPRFRRIYDDPKRYHSPNFYRRFALAEINGTMTASAQPENCGITHPFENRRFTIREAARIQSFPDDFTFVHKQIADGYKAIGNAVPPILGWVIARALAEHLANILK